MKFELHGSKKHKNNKSKFKASVAGDALNVAVSSLNSINDLVSGEAPLLDNAPPEIKGKAEEIVVGLKDLVDMLNKEVGKKKPKKKPEPEPEPEKEEFG